MAFLPISSEEALASGITEFDFIIVTGDAYVDHPSFGTAVIGRVLEAEGYSVAVIPQPDWRNTEDFKRFGKPRLAFLVNSGNIDSMVAHYTAARRKRNSDYYSPGGVAGKRPDRAVIVYCNRIREAYGDVPIVIGGVEASTRRFAHYDYWTDSVRRSILVDCRADILTYGMGENILRRIAFLLDKGVPVKKIRDVRGCCYLAEKDFVPKFETEFIGDYDTLKTDKAFFAKAFEIQARNQDPVIGKALVEDYGDKILIQTPPMPPLTRNELDAVYSLPFEREVHPSYLPRGGVPAINEVKFAIAHNRGCFGSCNFCSIAFHQGRQVVSRSVESVVREAEILAQKPDFKGYIHDIGGPTANFRFPSCEKQKKAGMCVNRKCLEPASCPNMKVDHSDYIHLLEQV
ncbi:MAG: YgiQ family radical SAM protein, partial [Clostridia bacterium]|nr:YgiQ family radical SAM protein [Clostridia bacterium]